MNRRRQEHRINCRTLNRSRDKTSKNRVRNLRKCMHIWLWLSQETCSPSDETRNGIQFLFKGVENWRNIRHTQSTQRTWNEHIFNILLLFFDANEIVAKKKNKKINCCICSLFRFLGTIRSIAKCISLFVFKSINVKFNDEVIPKWYRFPNRQRHVFHISRSGFKIENKIVHSIVPIQIDIEFYLPERKNRQSAK